MSAAPCVSARESEVPTPSESKELLADFVQQVNALRGERIGNGGVEVCRVLTETMDRAVASLVDTDSGAMALVALGGYGRRELSPHSDIDLMLLHELGDPADTAAEVFHPLWDAGLRVGHSVRTVREAATASREQFETQTTLLTARFVVGSSELFDVLMDEVARVTRARPLRRHIVAAERERRRITPFPLMAADIKTGRGGLRSLQGIEWERRREELIGRFAIDSKAEEDEVREILLQVRNALHAVTGRGHDVFSPELREPVAQWLGRDVRDVSRGLIGAMSRVDNITERRWPKVLEETQLPLSRRVWGGIRTVSPPPQTDTVADLETVDALLRTGERGRAVFDRLWESGRFAGILPEWAHVADLPHFAPFHQHPVAVHLWRTVAEIENLAGGNDLPGKVAADLKRPRLLRLAAFLHDIGKGHPGDHSVVGAEIAASFASRVALDATERALLADAVRHHLLLATTAAQRDLDDPTVITEVARVVGSLDLLRVLYLLTIADSRATGPTMWSKWKAALLQTLFLRCVKYLDPGISAFDHGTSREAVLVDAGESAESLTVHMDQISGDYFRSVSADDVSWHVELIEDLAGVSNLGVRRDDPIETVVVVGRPIPGFRHSVAATLAANGVDVVEARMFGRADGILIDIFRVRDDRTGNAVPDERWSRVRSDIESGLLGELDIDAKLAERIALYPVADNGQKSTVDISEDLATGEAVVHIESTDRIGRLAGILRVLDDSGIDIRLAQLDSREGELVDVFHIAGNVPVEDQDLLAQRIADAITDPS